MINQIKKDKFESRDFANRDFNLLTYFGLVKLFNMKDKITCIRRRKGRYFHFTVIQFYFKDEVTGEYVTSNVKIRTCNFSRYVTPKIPLMKIYMPAKITGYSFQSYWILDRLGSTIVFGNTEPTKVIEENGVKTTVVNRDYEEKLYTCYANSIPLQNFKTFLDTLYKLDIPGISMIKSKTHHFVSLNERNIASLKKRYHDYFSHVDYKLIEEEPVTRFITDEMANSLGLYRDFAGLTDDSYDYREAIAEENKDDDEE